MRISVLSWVLPVFMAFQLADAHSQTDWTQSIDQTGWHFVGASEDGAFVVLLRRAGPVPGSSYKRVWYRSEYKIPNHDRRFTADDGTTISPLETIELEEVDCAQGRTRSIQTTEYENRNLVNRSHTSDAGVSRWSYALPGSIGEAVNQWTCTESSIDSSSGRKRP
jgi:hypothetical protein